MDHNGPSPPPFGRRPDPTAKPAAPAAEGDQPQTEPPEPEPPQPQSKPKAKPRKSRLVPLTLFGLSALTLGVIFADDDDVQRAVYRTLADCEADYGPGRCETGQDDAGQALILGPPLEQASEQGTSSHITTTNIIFTGSHPD